MARLKKHPGRKRRIGGWVLLSLALLVAGVWVASGWWMVEWNHTGKWLGSMDLGHGMVDGWLYLHPMPAPQHKVDPPVTSGWSIKNRIGPFIQWEWDARVDSTGFRIEFPLWPLPLLLTLAGVPVLRSGVRALRRGKAGSCPACGYDRRGIPAAAVCPECGKGGI